MLTGLKSCKLGNLLAHNHRKSDGLNDAIADFVSEI